mmetsp:Transcript_8028/g.22273  ORF Transcript_8028/g.22273 Transcript_8028/m.22273 type:complete len:263 (+) Transcript_8028:357-1145(+)
MDRSPHSAMNTSVNVSQNPAKKPCFLLAPASLLLTASCASASSPSSSSPSSSTSSASLRVRTPKNSKSPTARYSPTGSVVVIAAGICWKNLPMATEMKLMSESAHTAPVRTVKRPSLIASSAAMKNVLSPSSLTKIRANAAVNPVLASAWYAAWPTTVFWVRTYPAHARAPSATARTAADLPLAFLGAASSPPSVPGAEMPAAAASGARVTFRRARPADRPRGTALGNPAPTPPSGPTEIRFGTACRARRSPVAATGATEAR